MLNRDEWEAVKKSLPVIPARRLQSHKGTFGSALLIAGSRMMSGAARLAGKGTLLAGAGLVRLLVPESIQPLAAADAPEYMTIPLPEDRKGRIALDAAPEILRRLETASAFGFGPGLDRSLGLERLAQTLFFTVKKPAVFDADGLNALSAREVFLPADKRTLFPQTIETLPAPRVLTPHPGEFARMTGRKTPSDSKARQEEAVDFVRSLPIGQDGNLVLLLKGAGTVVTDGKRVYVNSTGNPGMATGGSGDCLTGILTAFLAEGFPAYEAAVLAAAIHGRAGDLACERFGTESLTAGKLLEMLPEAFLSLNGPVLTDQEAERDSSRKPE